MGAYIFISVLIIIACVLLILVVLVQNSKGGGLASNFSSSNQYMGVRKTADFLEKATWILAVSLVVLSLVTIFIIPRGSNPKDAESELKEQVEKKQGGPVKNYQAPPQQQNKQQAPAQNDKK